MENVFDLVNLIFLILAIVIFLRLRSVLGRRTGHERPPRTDRYTRAEKPPPSVDAKTGAPDTAPDTVADTLTDAAGQEGLPGSPASIGDRAAIREGDWGPASQGLVEISLTDRDFDPEIFLSGARAAHELIVNAFPRGDRAPLRRLLSTGVFARFDAVITGREDRSETVEYSFIGLKSADILDAALKEGKALIAVKFVSEMVSCVKDSEGRIIEGDPVAVREIVDVWTFERAVKARDPNWQLVATGAVH